MGFFCWVVELASRLAIIFLGFGLPIVCVIGLVAISRQLDDILDCLRGRPEGEALDAKTCLSEPPKTTGLLRY